MTGLVTCWASDGILLKSSFPFLLEKGLVFGVEGLANMDSVAPSRASRVLASEGSRLREDMDESRDTDRRCPCGEPGRLLKVAWLLAGLLLAEAALAAISDAVRCSGFLLSSLEVCSATFCKSRLNCDLPRAGDRAVRISAARFCSCGLPCFSANVAAFRAPLPTGFVPVAAAGFAAAGVKAAVAPRKADETSLTLSFAGRRFGLGATGGRHF